MSQHIWIESNITVQVGHDRPLRYFYLTLWDHGEVIFSNLSLPNPAMSVEQITDVLTKRDLTVPEGLGAQLEADRRQEIAMGRSLPPQVYNETPPAFPVLA